MRAGHRSASAGQLDRCATDFDLSVSERWPGQDEPWQITPYSECVVSLGPDPVLTGYVDAYRPGYDRASHTVRIHGRSRTEDLIDCTPDIQSGQFAGYTLEAIARSICALFKIEVVVLTDAAKVIVADAKLERSETAWTFLERLCRLAGVPATDDERGRLVLTRAGDKRSSGALVQGQNILRAQAVWDVHKRFSDYFVKGQHGVGGAKTGGLDLSQLHGPGPATSSSGGGTAPGGVAPDGDAWDVEEAGESGTVLTTQTSASHDAGVPRYRPHVSMAESQLTQEGMALRANWQRAFAYGRSWQVHIDVVGWRQPDGRLWALNELIPVTSSFLALDRDLLIAQVEFALDDRGGRITRLMLGPVEGYTPDPGQVKLRRHKGEGHGGKKGGGGLDLSGLDPG
jgi:prophage tail gpP-like protein